jgi:carbonic anhydrase/acetyltransferase-like protein (isoleucine patch superfamily)
MDERSAPAFLPWHEALVASSAAVLADVALTRGVSIWFRATVRGDVAPIAIGAFTAVRDGAMIHPQTGYPVQVGSECVIGHGAVAHMIELGDGSCVGTGAVLMARSRIGKECLVAPGSLVVEGKSIPDRSVIEGVPGQIVRQVTDEEAQALRALARRLWEKARSFAT